MNLWQEEMAEIRAKRKLIYKPPLPVKMQRVTCRAERCSEPKIYSAEEIKCYMEAKNANTSE